MTVTGTGPKIEIFADRIEFSNPGEPVTDWNKLFGVEPRSRNERLAMAMRKMELCEERGSGLRRIITATNAIRLLPPEFLASKGTTKVILHGHKREFDAMDQNAKNRAIYQYASLLFEEGKWLTNSLLRARFPMTGNATFKASVALRACMNAKLIKLADDSRPNSGYLPFWA
jgi:ATP-dependent DNA helicase RecG